MPGLYGRRNAYGSRGTICAVAAADANHACAVGSDGIWSTSDGGASWTDRVSGSQARFEGVYDAPGGGLFAAGVRFDGGTAKSVIQRSVDGGETWTAVDNPGLSKLRTFHFADSQNGWVAGYEADQMMRTADGGKTWSDVPSAVFKDDLGRSHEIAGIAFFSPTRGYVAAPSASGVLHYTETGGAVWTSYTVPDAGIWDMEMPDASHVKLSCYARSWSAIRRSINLASGRMPILRLPPCRG